VVDLAAATCGDPEDVVPIEESSSAIATAMANAIAEVTGECTGLAGQITIQGTSRAEIRAEAVGMASAGVLASSTVCGMCTAELDSLVMTVETVAAEAVAQANLDVCTIPTPPPTRTLQKDEKQAPDLQLPARLHYLTWHRAAPACLGYGACLCDPALHMSDSTLVGRSGAPDHMHRTATLLSGHWFFTGVVMMKLA